MENENPSSKIVDGTHTINKDTLHNVYITGTSNGKEFVIMCRTLSIIAYDWIKTKVETYIINYRCDNCNSVDMLPTGVAYYTSPLQYVHECTYCGEKHTFTDKKYPLTEYRYINEW